MRLFLLTALTMVAFASNSLLTRAGVTAGGLGAVAFAMVRLGSGAVTLLVLCALLRGGVRLGGAGRVVGVASLLLYLFGFSVAYTGMDAGLGALVLFGMVQITMFAGSLLAGEAMPARRWLGAGLAFVGLGWLLWPGAAAAVSPLHGLAMAAAGIGWGVYSLAGRKAVDGLQATAANFILGSAVALVVGLVMTGGDLAQHVVVEASAAGLILAVLSGAVTSGLGYALWYALLPRLEGTVAAVAQLTVPVIAMAGGMIWLGEDLTLRALLAAVLVLGGVAVSVRPKVARAPE